MFYPNLEAEMKRNNLNRSDIAKVLGVHVSGVYRMLRGERKISVSQAKTIRDSLFPNLKLDYLFDEDPE